LHQQNNSDVGQEKHKSNSIAWSEVGGNLEGQSLLAVHLLVTKGWYLDGYANQRKHAGVDLFVEEGEVVVELFGDGEVEEDVEAAHGEVVDEAQEVDGEGERGADGDCGAGDF
jgi:hypothetical protein